MLIFSISFFAKSITSSDEAIEETFTYASNRLKFSLRIVSTIILARAFLCLRIVIGLL